MLSLINLLNQPNLVSPDRAEPDFNAIQNSYLMELSNKHYPAPLKKRSSISESLEGRSRNTRAGFLYDRTYGMPDTQFPSSSSLAGPTNKFPPPVNAHGTLTRLNYSSNSNNSNARDPPPYPSNHPYKNLNSFNKNNKNLTVIESETDSNSNNSPNNSINLDNSEYLQEKLIRNARKKFENLDKQQQQNSTIHEKPNAESYGKQFAENKGQSPRNQNSGSVLNQINTVHVRNNSQSTDSATTLSNAKSTAKIAPATPPRTVSKPETSPKNQTSPIHPVDLAIQKNLSSPGKKVGIVAPVQQASPEKNSQNSQNLVEEDSRNSQNSQPSQEPNKFQQFLAEQKTDGIRHNKLGEKLNSIMKPEFKHKDYDIDQSETSIRKGKILKFDPFDLLLDACLEGEFEEVERVIKLVENPSKSNPEGITGLHNAVCAGNMKIVEFLVHYGVDINAVDSDGWTPLHCAASCNNKEMSKFLIERGASIFAKTIWDKGTAADKCEELDDKFHECSTYLYSQQEKMGLINKQQVYGLYWGDFGDFEGTWNFNAISRISSKNFQNVPSP